MSAMRSFAEWAMKKAGSVPSTWASGDASSAAGHAARSAQSR
ncbi:hypothetical protein Q0F99_03600 [Rathayibacter oskolensis]|nr:hypothetical protein [Rathayibacter oskolensis]WKK72135.1 hypothetical protein Q0F99_03600 [Rathayibacter oskolensis]